MSKTLNLNTELTLKDCLFGAVKLNKNTDTDKYKYSGYDIGFDSQSEFSLPDASIGKNVIIFGADMSSSVFTYNRKKDILTHVEGLAQEIDDATLTAEAKYSINFTQSNKNFCLSLHYNGSNSFFLLMLQKYINLKEKLKKLKNEKINQKNLYWIMN